MGVSNSPNEFYRIGLLSIENMTLITAAQARIIKSYLNKLDLSLRTYNTVLLKLTAFPLTR